MQTRKQLFFAVISVTLIILIPILILESQAGENEADQKCSSISLDPSSKVVAARRERYYQNGGVDLLTSRAGIEAENITACVQRAIVRSLEASEFFYRFALDPASVVETTGSINNDGGERHFIFSARHRDLQLTATGQLRLEVSSVDAEELPEGQSAITCRFLRPTAGKAQLVFALAWDQVLRGESLADLPSAVEGKMFFGIKKFVATAGKIQGTITDQPLLFPRNYAYPCGGAAASTAVPL